MYWYADIGTQLCFTLALNTITPHLSKMALVLVAMFMRCWDRSCRCRLRKDEYTDEVYTKKVIQADLDEAYTGLEIESYFVYAQFFTNLWAILAYSGGMPVLYPVAVINFTFLYWIYKTLILKHYQKTSSFN